MRNLIKVTTLFTLLLILTPSRADEGMWLINLLDKNLTSKMRASGLKIDPKVIYDENTASLSDAVVALDFGCTGSIISKDGLLITNHHCAYGDVHALSTPHKNYLEDGFWAMKRDQEIYINGKSVYFLRKVEDVSDQVKRVSDSLKTAGQPSGMRKISSVMEGAANKKSGMESMLMSMWRGSKYYMFYYEVYTDIRLVGAPPVSIAAYGGETDNWEWPQHKGDFALYRVYGGKDGKPAKYSIDNVPITPKKVLNISTKGVKEGDFTMVMGFPGRTNRYNSSFGVNEKERVTNPVSVKLRKGKLQIMNSFMEVDPAVRLKYADHYFSISNVQELMAGEVTNFRRFGVVDIKKSQEGELQSWIMSDPERAEKWGDLLKKMEESYNKTEKIAKARKYFQETMVAGQGFIYMGNRTNSLKTAKEREKLDTLKVGSEHHKTLVRNIESGYESCDLRVEKELMYFQLREFLGAVPEEYWGDYIRRLYKEFYGDSKLMTDYVFENSIILNPDKFRATVSKDQPIDLYIEDPISQLSRSARITEFNSDETKIMNGESLFDMEAYYTRLVYQMNKERGLVQYPDANSTLRLTYGTVGPINPSDGIYYSSQSTTQGFIDKYNPDNYEFNIKPEVLSLLKSKDWGRWGDKGKLYVNFLSNNDITGGNSGRPITSLWAKRDPLCSNRVIPFIILVLASSPLRHSSLTTPLSASTSAGSQEM
jgi:hypothetical protein